MSEELKTCYFFCDYLWKFQAEQCRLYLYGALFIPLRQTVYSDSKGKKARILIFSAHHLDPLAFLYEARRLYSGCYGKQVMHLLLVMKLKVHHFFMK